MKDLQGKQEEMDMIRSELSNNIFKEKNLKEDLKLMIDERCTRESLLSKDIKELNAASVNMTHLLKVKDSEIQSLKLLTSSKE